MSLIGYQQQQQQQQYQNRAKIMMSNKQKSASRSRDKQRKCRVLVSIVLLLPALAAIIGIVAWAISIEMAQGSGAREPLARSQATKSPDQASLLQQFRRQQQAAKEETSSRLPVAASLAVNLAGQSMGRAAQQSGNKRRQPLDEGEMSAQEDPQASVARQPDARAADETEDRRQEGSLSSAESKLQEAGSSAQNWDQQPGGSADSSAEVEDDQPAASSMEGNEADSSIDNKDLPKEHRSRWRDDQQTRPITRTTSYRSPANGSQRRLSANNANQNKQQASSYLMLAEEEANISASQQQPTEVKVNKQVNGRQSKQQTGSGKRQSSASYLLVGQQMDQPAKASVLSNLQSAAGSDRELDAETQPPSAASQRPKSTAKLDKQSAKQKQQQDKDDELSFQAIASAISTSLSNQATDGQQQQQPTGRSPISDDGEQTVGSRKKSAGEHVAEVIDHIVHRRRQQLPVTSNGELESAGPQIVVVAPVAGSDAMRARSLVKEQDQKEATNRPVVARLLGADDQSFSERVEVIQDEDSSGLLASEEQSSMHVSSRRGEPRLRSPRHGGSASLAFERYAKQPEQPRIYSAEKLIMEHVKSRLERTNVDGPTKRSDNQQQVKAMPTTSRPHAAKPSQDVETKQLASSTTSQPISESEAFGLRQANNEFGHQARQLGRPPTNFRPQRQQDLYQPIESQQSVSYQPAGKLANEQQNGNFMGGQHQFQVASSQQLPVFADQEFNVPAHMAESVIQTIQRSPSTLINGRPTLISAGSQQMPAYAQVPHQYQYSQQQQSQSHFLPQQSTYNQYDHRLHEASSHQTPMFMAAPQLQQPQQQQQYPFWTRLLGGRFQQQARAGVQQQTGQLTPSSQSRNDAPLAASSSSDSGPLSITLKPPRGLVHPVASFALKHLISSLGSVGAREQSPAASNQLQFQVDESYAKADQKSPQSSSSLTETKKSRSLPIDNTMIQAQGSEPSVSAISPPSPPSALDQQQDVAARSPDQQQTNSQQMMSMAQSASQLQPQTVQLNDQEVQESYGQMPTYHMGPPPPSHYGGGYPPEHDKKTKGVTFHFGGGPIGGGTQLITSPMGILKHLMIPLMPNPRAMCVSMVFYN